MRSFIERLDRERTEAITTIDGVLERAGNEDRDTTDTENAMLTEARQRLERIDRERTEWAELAERRVAGDAVTDRIQTALVRSNPNVPSLVQPQGIVPAREAITDVWPDAGHYIHDVVTRSRGDTQAAERLDRAVANQILSDNPGIVPTPILGPVTTFLNRTRPLISSVMQRPMPGAGETFSRPKVTQHSLVGAQTAEKTEIASRNLQITGTPVTKKTYGGTLDISFQNRDWTEPALLQIAVDDLAGMYGQATDAGFATDFMAAVTQIQNIPGTTPTGEAFLVAIAQASATIFGQTFRMPDTIWVSPDMWASLVSAVDQYGRPLFVAISPSNAMGQLDFGSMNGSVFGLRLIADPNLTTGTMVVGVASLAEFYEQIGGQLSITEPTILGFVIAYWGYVAWLVVAPEAFVKVTVGP